jgi:hypothetical protein
MFTAVVSRCPRRSGQDGVPGGVRHPVGRRRAGRLQPSPGRDLVLPRPRRRLDPRRGAPEARGVARPRLVSRGRPERGILTLRSAPVAVGQRTGASTCSIRFGLAVARDSGPARQLRAGDHDRAARAMWRCDVGPTPATPSRAGCSPRVARALVALLIEAAAPSRCRCLEQLICPTQSPQVGGRGVLDLAVHTLLAL